MLQINKASIKIRPLLSDKVVSLLFVIVLLFFVSMAHAFKLPDTGQTLCYDSSGNVIACAGTGQDGEYNISPRSYTDNGDGTVTDNNTGLMWQQHDNGITYNWYEASGTYHTSFNPGSESVCGSLTLVAYWDWRLPSRKELITIVDYSIPAPGPTINPVFTNTGSSNYWSSRIDAYPPDCTGCPQGGGAWGVNFSDGYVNNTEWMGETYRVRCVRGEQQSPAFTDNGNDTVTDQQTGIVWQKQDDDVARTWEAALSYCEGLNLGSQSDWRLPNIIELESIVDDSRQAPAIDPVFTNTKAAPYCSSTSYTPSPNYAWFVIFGAGEAAYNDDGITKDYSYYVRCARGGQSGSLGKLTLSISGSGSGIVAASPTGSSCGMGCFLYESGTLAVLSETPYPGSIFSGWTGDVDCTDGVVTATDIKACTGIFSLCSVQPARIGSTEYDSINLAYTGAAASGDSIEVIASNQQETPPLNFDQGKLVTLMGGYDCQFVRLPYSYTIITGSLTISSGAITIDRIAIQ